MAHTLERNHQQQTHHQPEEDPLDFTTAATGVTCLPKFRFRSPFTKAPTVTSGPQRSQLHSMALQQREMFAVRHRPFSPTADASTRTLAAVKRLNPAGMEQAGASSTFLNLCLLYTSPSPRDRG